MIDKNYFASNNTARDKGKLLKQKYALCEGYKNN